MWKDEKDNMLDILDEIEKGQAKFPTVCPNCGSNSTHIYIQDHGDKHCGVWIWCSECGAYAHMSGQTPNWWKNPVFIDENELCSEPDYLDGKFIEIDEWVNNLVLGKKIKGTQNIIEDRFKVRLKIDIQELTAGTEGVLVIKNNFKTMQFQFICDCGKVVDIMLSKEELLQAVEIL